MWCVAQFDAVCTTGVLILVKLKAKACIFTKINTAPWAFFTFFKLYKWYQIAQHTTYFTFQCHYYSEYFFHIEHLTDPY